MSNARLAQELGLSEATVSRVMNNKPGVSPRTVERVRAAARQRGLATRPGWAHPLGLRYNVVGLLVLSGDATQTCSWSFHQTIAGVEDALRSKGVELVYARASEPAQLPRRIAAGEVDGVVLAGTHPDTATLDALGAVPQVWVCSRRERDCDLALAGNNAVAQIAADYLLGRGHTVLAGLNPLASHPAMRSRLDYFEYLAVRRGAQVSVFSCDADDLPQVHEDDPLRVIAGIVDRQVEQMLARSPRPTGVFAATDLVSGLVYRALRQRGLRPGHDVDVIGCDDDPGVLAGLHPRPATIDIAPFTMGRRSVEQLLWRIAHPDEEPRVQVVVEPRLVPGESL